MNDQARKILDENVLGVLATVNEDGSPWATPLHFAHDGEALYWFSANERVHSINIVRDGRANVALFSPDTSGGLKGVYVSGRAEVLAEEERSRAHDLFVSRLGSVPPSFASWNTYRLPIGTLDEQKSTGGCWYFYS